MKTKSLKKIIDRRKKRRLPLVSVVMPVYNAEKYVGEAIESILKQTYKRFELIIVEDRSTDSSLDIIKFYKRRYPSKIKVLRTPENLNCGGDMCANLGIGLARGKYIAKMDADDIAIPDRLMRQVAFLEKNKRVFLVGSSAHVINKRGTTIGEKLEPTKLSEIYRSYATFHPIIHPTAMFRRVFKGTKFFYQIKYSANNDYYTFFKLICKGYIFANLPEKLLFYRIHDKNDTFVNIKEKFLNTLKIRINMILEFNYKPTVRDVFISLAQAAIILALPEEVIRKIYLVAKGIIKPSSLNIPPLLSRLILRSSI